MLVIYSPSVPFLGCAFALLFCCHFTRRAVPFCVIGCVFFHIALLCFWLCWLAVCFAVLLRRGIPLPHLCSIGAFSCWKPPLTAYQQKRFFLWYCLDFLLFVCRRFIFLALLCLLAVLYRLCILRFVCSVLIGCVLYGACCSRASFFAGVLHYNLLGRVDPCFLILRHYGSPLIFLYHIRSRISYNSFQFSFLFHYSSSSSLFSFVSSSYTSCFISLGRSS